MVNQSITKFEVARLHEGAELEYEVRGDGEPVLLIHGALVGNAFGPLMTQTRLTKHYRLVNYHRRGYNGSSRSETALSIKAQAADALALLDVLGIEKAHVAGHSYGGSIALQLALDAPGRVQSLVLLEPAIMSVPSAPALMAGIGELAKLHAAGRVEEALDLFGQAVVGPRFREVFDATLDAGWFEGAMRDAGTFFEFELAPLAAWQFTRELAGRITQPALSVLGSESAGVDPSTGEVHELLQAWMPQTEAVIIPGATHGLQMMDPAGVASEIAPFLARHPITVPVS